MKALQKKLISVLLICALLLFGAVVAGKSGVWKEKPVSSTEVSEDGTEEEAAYENADSDLTFWYEDASYTDFFREAARRYFAQTGVKVSVECQNTIDYIGDIYDKTMQDDAFPDVYLIQGDNLEEAYLYGLVSVNEKGLADVNIASNAVKASTYGEKLLGYPLSFNTCVFVYQPDYFGEAPASLQSIIDYSNENEPAENVEYLLEWDVNDAFYDFPFIGNSVTFEKNEADTMNVIYNEEMYQQDLEYFDTILASFSVDADTVSEEHIIGNFLAGRTLSAIIDTDTLSRLEGCRYELMQMPNLNENLSAPVCAMTDMLVVNDFSKNQAAAADFAHFVTVTMAEDLYGITGHFSVIPSESQGRAEQVAFAAYETAVLVPDSKDARDFWVNLQEAILKYF